MDAEESPGWVHRPPPTAVEATRTWTWSITCPAELTGARNDRPPVPAVDRDPALGGLGRHLVARLSAAFGWAVEGRRTHVRAALRTTV